MAIETVHPKITTPLAEVRFSASQSESYPRLAVTFQRNGYIDIALTRGTNSYITHLGPKEFELLLARLEAVYAETRIELDQA